MNKTTVMQAATFVVGLLTLFVALFGLALVAQRSHMMPEVRYVTKTVLVTPIASSSPTLKPLLKAASGAGVVLPVKK